MKYCINMMSRAETVKGQGVGSAYEEQVALVQNGLSERFFVVHNRWKPGDITHYHTVNFPFYLSISAAKRRGSAVGYVHFLPETMEQSLKLPKFAKQVFYKYLMSFYRRMDYLVTVNPYFIDRLAAYGVDKSKVTYIPNYVSETDFHLISPEDKRSARKKYGLDPVRFTVVCAGQLQTRKGVFDFVECAERLPEIQFLWAGGFSFGRITDGYEEIRKIVENPPPNLAFPGIVDRSEMNTIYNLGDVMFLPSFDELFPMTILEAMCCNIPILLRDIPIYENILFDYYVKEPDCDGFVRALKRLSSDPAYYEEARAASMRGHAFYNREHVLSMWDAFYTRVIEEQTEKKQNRRKKQADIHTKGKHCDGRNHTTENRRTDRDFKADSRGKVCNRTCGRACQGNGGRFFGY